MYSINQIMDEYDRFLEVVHPGDYYQIVNVGAHRWGGLADVCVRVVVQGNMVEREGVGRQLALLPDVTPTEQVNLFGEWLVALDGLDWFKGYRLILQDGRYYTLRRREGVPVVVTLLERAGQMGAAVAYLTGPAIISGLYISFLKWKHWHLHQFLIHEHDRGDGRNREAACVKGLDCPAVLEAPDERTFFEHLEIPWMEPQERDYDRMFAILKARVKKK